MQDFLTLAKERYSCRSFSDHAVEKEKIDKIIEAAIAAPTAGNKQAWYAWVVEDEISQAVVRASTPCHFDAPVLIILGVKPEEAGASRSSGINFADVDGGIVGAHMLLAARDLGLDGLWVGDFNADAIQEAFTETDGYRMIGIFPIGYAADDAEPSKLHFTRKAASEICMTI